MTRTDLTTFSPEDLQKEVERLGPWFSAFDFGPDVRPALIAPHCDHAFFIDRADRLFDGLARIVAPNECSLIDLGCADGFFTVEAARRGYREVVGFDGRAGHLARAKLAAQAFGVDDRIEFVEGNLYEIDSLVKRTFDVVLMQGLLYHLPDPVLGVRKARALTGKVIFVAAWTDMRPEPTFRLLQEDPTDERNALQEIVLIPSGAAILSLLSMVGFREVRNLVELPPREDGGDPYGSWREIVGVL